MNVMQIGNKKYRHNKNFKTKSKAEKFAKDYRKRGGLARVKTIPYKKYKYGFRPKQYAVFTNNRR